MQNHNEMYHGDDGDFTCSQCPFQGNNLDRLTAHIEAAHELMMKCNNCDEKFKTKPSLMSHRKIVHESLISHCRYYKNGNCKFNTACWYKHENDQTENQISMVTQFGCNMCEYKAPNKQDLMHHIKKNIQTRL